MEKGKEKVLKVVDVLSPSKVVLNCGIEDDISMGNRFLLYTLGEIIKDPDTGEELERLEIVRGKGKVTHVQQRICTVECTDQETIPVKIRRTTRTSLTIFGSPSEEEEIRRENLPFDEVQIGDFARFLG